VKTRIEGVKIWLWAMLPICAAVLSSGCSSTGKHVCWYSGPPREAQEIALLKVQRSVFHESAMAQTIDGEPLSKGHGFSRNNTLEIELLPGPHTLGVAYFEGRTHSISNAVLTASFQAGHTYNLQAQSLDAGAYRTIVTAAFGGWGWWTAWVTDVNTKEVVAGVPRLEPRRWYEY
jgi:hypothetical protein